jgi:hypothetical protein
MPHIPDISSTRLTNYGNGMRLEMHARVRLRFNPATCQIEATIYKITIDHHVCPCEATASAEIIGDSD